MQTNDYAPAKRRAIRLALPAGVVLATGVGAAEWWLYTEVDPVAGSFMLMPSAALGVLTLLFGSRAVYRLVVGKRDDAEPTAHQQPCVEQETRENQGSI